MTHLNIKYLLPLKKIGLLVILNYLAASGFATGHFVAAFTGNGQNQMNINVATATIGGVDLEAGDEIAAFDGTICCGLVVLTQPIVYATPASFAKIAPSQADAGLSNGYTAGHAITYRFWDSSTGREIPGITSEYINPATGLTTTAPTYTVGATAFVKLSALLLQVTVFMEGFSNPGASAMNTTLRAASYFPLNQPYNVAPLNYAGTEHVVSVPAGVVDWILVELRQAATPAAALSATKLTGWPKAYFLKSNGAVVDLDGVSLPYLGYPSITGNLYVVIRHRNHIAVMSSAGVTLTGGIYSYNFTGAVTQSYGGSGGYKLIANGVYGMVSGDANCDGGISVLDFTKWATDFGKSNLYLTSDINEDGSITVLDFTKWATNFGQTNIAPVKSLTIGGGESQPVVSYKCQVPGN